MGEDSTGRKRRWRVVSLCAVVAVLGVAALAWNLPARWALPWIVPRLHGVQLQGVSGSLWDGRAKHVVLPDGRALGGAAWEVSRRAVYTAMPVPVKLDGGQLAFSAAMRALPHGRAEWTGVRLRTNLAAWPIGQMAGLGQPLGEWQMTAGQVLLQGGWPLQLELDARWRDAVLRTPSGLLLPLGELALTATAHDGVVDVRIRDVGAGPLQTRAQFLLSPLGWRLDAQLRQRGSNPLLRRWLAALGAVDAAGVVHVQRHGGLALPPPAAAAAGQAAAVGAEHER
jgi:general secretion pathway protein N